MSEWLAGEFVLQHLVVSLVAIGAGVVVARKVLGVFEKPRTPSGSAPGCDHCGAAQKKSEKG